MALNNLDRFVAQARNPLSIGTLFERDTTALATLVQIFATSQHFSDLLVSDPEGLIYKATWKGAPVAQDARGRSSPMVYARRERGDAFTARWHVRCRIAYGDYQLTCKL